MNNRRDELKASTISAARQAFGVLLIVCLALVLAAPALRLWAGIALVALVTIYVILEQALATYGLSPDETERQDRPKVADPDFWQASVSSVVDVEKRLKTLRHAAYHANAGWLCARTAKREMRAISPECRPYYERMMLAERSVYTILNTVRISGVKPKDMMKQVQRLSQQIAVLVEQIQLADRLSALYDEGSDEAIMVARARGRLIWRADRAMHVLEGVPARLLQLGTAASARGLSRLSDELDSVNTTLEGKAEAYEEMIKPAPYLEEAESRLKQNR